MGEDAAEIAHCPRGEEQRCFFSESILEVVLHQLNCGVLLENVVTKGRGEAGFEHRGSRASDGIGSNIDATCAHSP